MTAEQFAALSTLARLRDGPQREAARLHLVEGMPRTLAAQAAGCSPQGLHNTLVSVRRVQELARVACELDLPPAVRTE